MRELEEEEARKAAAKAGSKSGLGFSLDKLFLMPKKTPSEPKQSKAELEAAAAAARRLADQQAAAALREKVCSCCKRDYLGSLNHLCLLVSGHPEHRQQRAEVEEAGRGATVARTFGSKASRAGGNFETSQAPQPVRVFNRVFWLFLSLGEYV